MTLWAYDLSRIDELQQQLRQRAEHKRGPAAGRLPRVQGNIVVIPVFGTITQRGDLFGTSTEGLEAVFQRAVDSDRVGAVVLDVDSPGGTTSGVQMASDRIFAARGSGKPIVAVANSLAASAAFWIGSSADTFVAAPGADVGSIGVFRMHMDFSESMAKEGLRPTFISMPEFKTEGNPFEPLSEEAREHHLEQVRDTFTEFNRAVARNRGVSTAAALEGFGKGRTFHSNEAAARGMVDRVASMGRVMAELGAGRRGSRIESADDDFSRELCELYVNGSPTERKPFPRKLKAARLRLDALTKTGTN